MSLLVTFRHGERVIETGELSGDGPLTDKGVEQVSISANILAFELNRLGQRQIDLAVVSGSIRCAATFAIIWQAFVKADIIVRRVDMSKAYFSTSEEDEGWRDLYEKHKVKLLEDIKNMGEKCAYYKHALHLIKPCVQRIIDRIQEAYDSGSKSVLVVTHAPHDCLIEGNWAIMSREFCLELGKYSIKTF